MHSDGDLTIEELESDPRRNSLRSCIYGDIIELVDHPSEPLILQSDDLIIIASDGVETLSTKEIEGIIAMNKNETSKKIVKNILSKIEEKNQSKATNIYTWQTAKG